MEILLIIIVAKNIGELVQIVYFAHYGDVNPMNMIIPRCSTPCAFRKFKRTVESKFVVDAKNTC